MIKSKLRLWQLVLLLSLPLIFTACVGPKNNQKSDVKIESEQKMTTRTYEAAPGLLPEDKIKNKIVVMETQKGTIKFELFAEEAPLTVSNFVFLTNNNFYNDLTFHRVEPGFVIQGGDPSGNGTGGPGYRFADEPVKRAYDRRIVAMANAGPNTNGSQFFIMLENTPLPPNYTIFGQVIEGMEVVDKIRVGDVMKRVMIEDKLS